MGTSSTRMTLAAALVVGAGLAAFAGCSTPGAVAPVGQADSSFSSMRESVPVTTPTGVYLGAQVNPTDGPVVTPQQMESKTEELEHAIRRKLALHLQYRDWKAMVDVASDVGIRDDMANGRVPVISWTCADDAGSSKYNLVQIIEGRADGDLKRIVLQLESLKDAEGHPYPVILRYFWEFNINATGGAGADANGNGGCFVPSSASGHYTNQEQFKLAWSHIRQFFNASKSKLNVAFAWNPNITHNLYVDPATYYPNPSEVDWIGIDGYNKEQNGKPVGFSAIFTPLYTEFTGNRAYYGNKPIMVGETGSCGEYAPPNDQPSFLESIAKDVAPAPAQFPAIHAINYFDAPGHVGGCTWSFTTAGITAFAKLAALPYFSYRLEPSGGPITPADR